MLFLKVKLRDGHVELKVWRASLRVKQKYLAGIIIAWIIVHVLLVWIGLKILGVP